MRPLALIANLGMLLATPDWGHYFVELLAGVALAMLAIAAAQRQAIDHSRSSKYGAEPGGCLARSTAIGSCRSSETTKKASDRRGPCCRSGPVAYFSDVLIDVNLPFRLVPRPFTIAMIASEIPAAISPYSMAVAPDSSLTKRAMRFFIGSSMCTRGFELKVGLAGVLSTVTMATP